MPPSCHHHVTVLPPSCASCEAVLYGEASGVCYRKRHIDLHKCSYDQGYDLFISPVNPLRPTSRREARPELSVTCRLRVGCVSGACRVRHYYLSMTWR